MYCYEARLLVGRACAGTELGGGTSLRGSMLRAVARRSAPLIGAVVRWEVSVSPRNEGW